MSRPQFTRDQVLSFLKSSGFNNGSNNSNSRGLTLYLLGFSYTGRGCFELADATRVGVPRHALEILNKGGRVVATTQGYRIMTAFDPLQLNPGLKRELPNDMIVSTPNGLMIFPRNRTAGLPANFVEVFQRPLEAGACGDSENSLPSTPVSAPSNNFKIPLL
jgi:hypothetical protein